jgi:hypothetical protein
VKAIALGLVLSLSFTGIRAFAGGEETGSAATAAEIAWVKDYEEGVKKSKEEKKGLLVYLTPSWMECGFCKRLQKQGFDDEEIAKYVNERFTSVWIEDTQEDPWATKLGISIGGYPVVAVYAAGPEYVGQVDGFGGRDWWFDKVKAAVATGEALTAAKAKAEKDPAQWLGVAELLAKVPNRTADAKATLEKVPEKSRTTKEYKQLSASLGATAAWAETLKTVRESFAGVRSVEVAKEKAGKALETIDAFLKAHLGASPEIDAAALSKKAGYLGFLDREKEAVEIARKLLEKYPESEAVDRILAALRQIP